MGEVVTGITGGENEAPDTPETLKVRIWAGASKENRFTAPFRVLQDGSFVATKADISTEINAVSGQIGGFDIGPERIGLIDNKTPEFKEVGANTPGGLALLSDRLKFSSPYCWTAIGVTREVLPPSYNPVGSTTQTAGLGVFVNNTLAPYGTNYGFLVNVTGGLRNFALKTSGGIVSDSYIISYGLTKITPNANTCHIPGELTRPTLFQVVAKFINKNSGIGLPSRQSIQQALDLTATDSFSVEFVIVVDRASTQTGYITGRNTFIKGADGVTNVMDNTNYPYRINRNGVFETGKMNLTAGNCAIFRLDFDGATNYVAYLL